MALRCKTLPNTQPPTIHRPLPVANGGDCSPSSRRNWRAGGWKTLAAAPSPFPATVAAPSPRLSRNPAGGRRISTRLSVSSVFCRAHGLPLLGLSLAAFHQPQPHPNRSPLLDSRREGDVEHLLDMFAADLCEYVVACPYLLASSAMHHKHADSGRRLADLSTATPPSGQFVSTYNTLLPQGHRSGNSSEERPPAVHLRCSIQVLRPAGNPPRCPSSRSETVLFTVGWPASDMGMI